MVEIELNKKEIKYFKDRLDGQYINVHRLIEEPNLLEAENSLSKDPFTNLQMLIPELHRFNADYKELNR